MADEVIVLDQTLDEESEGILTFVKFEPPLKLSRSKLKASKHVELGDDLRVSRGEAPEYDLNKPIKYAWIGIYKDSADLVPVNSVDAKPDPEKGAIAYSYGVAPLSDVLRDFGREADVYAPSWDEVFGKRRKQALGRSPQERFQTWQQQSYGHGYDRPGPTEKEKSFFWTGAIVGGLVGIFIGKASSNG